MLTITVGATDVYDEGTERFESRGGIELHLEHSLVSLSKWESKNEKPFLGAAKKSPEEWVDYVRCMLQPPFPPEDFVQKLSKEDFDKISAYLDSKQTATWFSEQPGAPKSREVITAELIYYWMTVFSIPWEAQHWHLNRLFTLIRVCNLKQEKPKKMSRSEVAQRNRELNEQRRRQMGTKG